jgi:hypothetical protein
MNREFNLTKRVQNQPVGFAGMGISRSCSARTFRHGIDDAILKLSRSQRVRG